MTSPFSVGRRRTCAAAERGDRAPDPPAHRLDDPPPSSGSAAGGNARPSPSSHAHGASGPAVAGVAARARASSLGRTGDGGVREREVLDAQVRSGGAGGPRGVQRQARGKPSPGGVHRAGLRSAVPRGATGGRGRRRVRALSDHDRAVEVRCRGRAFPADRPRRSHRGPRRPGIASSKEVRPSGRIITGLPARPAAHP